MITKERITTIFAVAILSAGHCVAADSPPPLTKSAAEQMLSTMGYYDVKVGAVVQGLPMLGSRNAALVLAVGRRDGASVKIERSLLYDDDLGWFEYEYDIADRQRDPTSPTRLRFWTAKGYSQVLPTADTARNTILIRDVRYWVSGSGESEFRPNGSYWFKPKGEASMTGEWYVRGNTLNIKLSDGPFVAYTMSDITTNSFRISASTGTWLLTPNHKR